MTAERKPKAVQPWVVGTWNEEGSFIPNGQQPETPITDLHKMVAWVKQNIGEAGAYEFVRKSPGRLVIAVQQTMKAVMEG